MKRLDRLEEALAIMEELKNALEEALACEVLGDYIDSNELDNLTCKYDGVIDEIQEQIDRTPDLEDREVVYDLLIEYNIATSNEIDLVCDILGYNIDTLDRIVYARTGLEDIEQFLEEEEY